MEMNEGYKQVGESVIPNDWDCVELDKVAHAFNGKATGVGGSRLRVFKTKHVYHGKVRLSQAEFVPDRYVDVIPRDTYLETGDVLTPNTAHGTIGRVSLVPHLDFPSVCDGQVMVIRSLDQARLNSHFAYQFLSSNGGRQQILQREVGSIFGPVRGQTHLYPDDVLTLSVPLPNSDEQEAIAEALSDADALIESLEQLIAKKRKINQGAMQELLTGKIRLPVFSGRWEVKRIADIGTPSSEKNWAQEDLKVLTCSKHLGFVESLGYFKNQVFSKDTSGYKVIRRGEIGYPSNHVEEGSIGLQDRYDSALVSPIYVIFSVCDDVDSYFLHRLLKLDSYRQEFAKATLSSVDRRGSLRWPAFSELTVVLPPTKDEQIAITEILRDMEAEIAALDTKLRKARQVKQGMMQELLTGKIRLIQPEASYA